MLGLILGLGLLMFLAYKGMSIIWIAPICALVVAVFGGLPLLPTYTTTYMDGFVGFTRSWFPIFMLGAIFGKIMEETGMAQAVAHWFVQILGKQRAILAVVVGCAILTYGGVSLFVVVFAMYPLALALFREANISRKLIPGCIALGSFTFTMTALPGTPQIQNLIPMEFFKTPATAAPIMGIAAGIVLMVGGYLYMIWKEKRLTAAGEVFTEGKGAPKSVDASKLPNTLLSFVPIIVVPATLNLPFLKFPPILALLSGIVVAIALNPGILKKLVATINAGANASLIAIINTSAAVGFGMVVRAVPAFKTLTDALMDLGGNPLISLSLAVNALAGATGSASGGLGIALRALGAEYLALAQATGLNPEALHRIASLSSGGLDTLPHNGAVLTLLAVTGLTHQDSYFDIFVVSLLMPVLATVVAIVLASMGLV
ncbi:MAG: GntP family permease [Selenomonadales bacterium]|nr:GntP family permease [Selenomonadales bacterium]